MANYWYENEDYQTWLLTQERTNIIPSILYKEFIKNIDLTQENNILDFGFGTGYVSSYYSAFFEKESNTTIYSCECNEDYLDQFQYKITKEERKNIRLFFHPHDSNITFSNWLPKFNFIICSLIMSTLQRPNVFLRTMKKYLTHEGVLNIVDWKKENNQSFVLTNFISEGELLSLEEFKKYLDEEEYQIIQEYTKNPEWYALTIQPKKIV